MASPQKDDPNALYARLQDPDTDTTIKAETVHKIRDSLEQWIQHGWFPNFLARYVPLLLKLLDGPVPFNNLSPDQKLRNGIYDLIHRFPPQQVEAVKPFASSIIDKMLDLFPAENEDNAVLIIKIFMDFQRGHAAELGDRLQKFLDMMIDLFSNMDKVVKDTFGDSDQQTPAGKRTAAPGSRPQSPAATGSDGSSGEQQRTLHRSKDSFKVLAECPITVVSIFQQHKRLMNENMPRFAPLVKQLLQLQASPQEQAHAEAAARGEHFIGVAKGIKDRKAYSELIAAQVKTMSFLAYILKAQADLMKDFIATVPDVIVRLLKDCPKEKCGVRKELLIAIRHIINFNFRTIFIKSVDDLLDERILLGDGLGAAETQKGLAFSLLADLIHHLRDRLTESQIRLAVRVYTKHLRDTVPGTSFQTMSSKLLFNMADKISKMENKQDARVHLILILDAVGDKMAQMNRAYPNALKLSEQGETSSLDQVAPSDFLADKDHPPDWDEIDIFSVAPIKVVNTRDRGAETLFDNKFLFRNLLQGLKTIIFQLKNCNGPAPVDEQNTPSKLIWDAAAWGFDAEEITVLGKLLHEGIAIFQYYPSNRLPANPDTSPLELISSHFNVENAEEKELYDTFATVFHHIDSAVFHEIFGRELPFMYDMMLTHPNLLQIPQFLLASEATSPHFAGMLLEFLMSRIHEVGSADVAKATILLRLFKLSFMAVTLFAQVNEAVLLPHIKSLITQSLELATTAEAPMHYFCLLRALFRSIGGGKFEHLYKEILPLLEMLLEKLNSLISSARNVADRELFVELSLTVPARLSHLLPHLSYLMKPLVLALQTTSDLVGQGLRTLELCVDNLTAEYLDPIMAPVIHDLSAALWSHLQPAPYPVFYAHTTMRILGKLGGRNRRFLDGPPSLEYEPCVEKTSNMSVRLIGSSAQYQYPAFIGIQNALQRLDDSQKKTEGKVNDAFYKQQALDLIISRVKLLIKAEDLPPELAQMVRLQADDLSNGVLTNGSLPTIPLGSKSSSEAKRRMEKDLLKDLLVGILSATTLPSLKEKATMFLKDLYRHFAVLEVGRALADAQEEQKPFSTDVADAHWCLDHRIIIDAIIIGLSSEKAAMREAAGEAIADLKDNIRTIFGNNDGVLTVSLFSSMLSSCCHSCHREDWWSKAGGSLGIKVLTEQFGASLIQDRQVDVCRALIYAAKDLPDVVPKAVRTEALETLTFVIRAANESASKEDLTSKDTKLYSLCTLLVNELSSVSKPVRQAVQDALRLVAETLQVEVHELVAPMKVNLLSHIFTKPLRTVAEPIQVGYIEAVAFCLELGNGVLELNEKFARFISETMALVNQDDDPMSVPRMADERHARNVIKLKVSCLHLLSLALNLIDEETSAAIRSKPKVISVFFKSLYSRFDDVVEAGNEALKVVVVKDSKLPKDILQNGLRPILVSLGEPQNLRMAHMKTLARLLSLLKSYFKVEIGSRLLDKIFDVVDKDTLQKASFQHLEQQERIKVLAAVFNVFHLLPEAAREFMSKLVTRALELEHSLRRTHNSPLRLPVVMYLNRYPQEAWNNHFAHYLANREHSRFLAQVLPSSESGPLREVLVENAKILLQTISMDQVNAQRWTLVINGINIISALCQNPESGEMQTLFAMEGLKPSLFAVGRALNAQLSSNHLDPAIRLAADQAADQILRLLTSHVEQDPKDIACLFTLLEHLSAQEIKNVPSIWHHCIYQVLLESPDLTRWNNVMHWSLRKITATDSSEHLKAMVLRVLVQPMLARDIMRNWAALQDGAHETPFLTKNLTKSFKDLIWHRQASIEVRDENTAPGTEATRMEFLQLATLVLKYCKNIATTHEAHKEIVKLGFTYTRLEDVLNKYAAHVLIAYYCQAYPNTPMKVALTVYQPLVKAAVSEARVPITQGLEVLTPVLENFMENNDTQTAWPWLPLATKPIKEDPGNVQQTQSILAYVTRHPDLFYEARDNFIWTIYQVLPRVFNLPVQSLDAKKMVVNMITLLWKWQQVFAQEALAKGGQADAANPFAQSVNNRTVIIKYLANFIMTLTDRYPVFPVKTKDTSQAQNHVLQALEVCTKSMELFENLLSAPHWSDIDPSMLFPRLDGYLKAEANPDDKTNQRYTAVVNSLQLLRAMVNIRSDEWIASNLSTLQKLLDKLLRNPNREIQECLHSTVEYGEGGEPTSRKPLVQRILEAVPPEPAQDEMDEAEDNASPDFVQTLLQTAYDCLQTPAMIAGINIFRAVAATRPRKLDEHWAGLTKAINSAARDYMTLFQQQSQEASAGRSMDPTQQMQQRMALEMSTDALIKLIDLFGSQLARLGDHRRSYLQLLAHLAERSQHKRICTKILDLISTWVFMPDQTYPSVKEKNAVIIKMIIYMKRDQDLSDKFLDLIARIYEDPKVTRSELAIRLEAAFLAGTSTDNLTMRSRFMTIFDRHLSRSANKRLLYLLAAQDWHELKEKFWLSTAIELLIGSFDLDATTKLIRDDSTSLHPLDTIKGYNRDGRIGDVVLDESFEGFMTAHKQFCNDLRDLRARSVLEPLCRLQMDDSNTARQVWRNLFPLLWSVLVKEERSELSEGLISLMTKEYHHDTMDKRPNCIQVLVEGIVSVPKPQVNFPPHIMRYLATTFDCWYAAMCYMEDNAFNPIVDTPAARESNQDALAETYAALEESDMFYGLWRRRTDFLETLTALSFEQHGEWSKAQQMFEAATIKARTGAKPFKQGEYQLWEDHYVRCAQKLQQWDILVDFAKNDNLNDLFLDAVWRVIEKWHGDPSETKQLANIINIVSDAPTPRRSFFQSFKALLDLHKDSHNAETHLNFTRINDEAIQLSIRKWHQLPKRVTPAHIPILQNFQQLCELYDASVICNTISNTTAGNLDQKAPELKLQLNTWRDRLPNFWDDITAWQELVTWRQHIFFLINKKYLSIMPNGAQQGGAAATQNSLAFRGYHETASIINRFAHVARKHNLPDVCIAQLSKIYTLPNIEIQEAFLKLREQAKCHYHNENELQTGLDVINNTNLNYFGPQQKAEFYVLKGMFLAKQENVNDANDAFGTALFFDLKLPKAWAEWARYNDYLFKHNPEDLSKAAAAISCYLEAASTYRSAKSRKFISRIIWLLSLDDAGGSLAKTFEDFKSELTSWYWIAFIPQLTASLSRPEGRVLSKVLLKLAQSYPQALFYSLRTTRDDLNYIKKQTEAREMRMKQQQQLQQQNGQQASPKVAAQGSPVSRPITADGRQSSSRPGTGSEKDGTPQVNGAAAANTEASPKQEPGAQPQHSSPSNAVKQETGTRHQSPKGETNQRSPQTGLQQVNGQTGQNEQQTHVHSQPRRPWEYAEEILTHLKTAFPLLAISLELMIDQIFKNMRVSSDEDAYRLIVALQNDAVVYLGKSPLNFSRDTPVPSSTEQNVARFADAVFGQQPQLKKVFEQEFVTTKPSLYDYVLKLRKWRDKFEEKLDSRRTILNLESCGPILSEFKYQKFDEVEIPGQYLSHKDTNKDFVRIDRFMPDVDLVRGQSNPSRRLWIRGHDGSVHPFMVQHPTAKTAKRDERMLQAVRFFNDVLSKRKESRRRNIQFTAPAIINIAPAMRIVQDDPSYITLQGIYDDYCRRNGTPKDGPMLFVIQKLKEMRPQSAEEVAQIRTQAFEVIQQTLVPKTIVLNHFKATHSDFPDFWLLRRAFAYQLAAHSFLTFIFSMRERTPTRMSISRATGLIWPTELSPGWVATQPPKPIFGSPETVPFRLSPNLQMFLGPIALEGIFAPAMLVIAKALMEPSNGTKLEQTLSLFVRDEVIHWHAQNHRREPDVAALRTMVTVNAERVVNRVSSMSFHDREAPIPVNQSVLDMVARACDPQALAQMDVSWMPWL